ncbi:MAG: hypothetical protein P9L93_03270 [Candidatus Gorgyraea atricola]|nr:hypothetical protein [Candidatus Gorgyraea atricola]
MGTILYNYAHSLNGFLCFLMAGVLIDADHYLDYAREHGISLNLKKVYNTCKTPTSFKRLTLILHSYEFVIILWALIFAFDLNIIWNYIAIGFTLHLLIDQVTNPVRSLSYFFLFRALNSFKVEKVFITKRGVEHAYWNR